MDSSTYNVLNLTINIARYRNVLIYGWNNFNLVLRLKPTYIKLGNTFYFKLN